MKEEIKWYIDNKIEDIEWKREERSYKRTMQLLNYLLVLLAGTIIGFAIGNFIYIIEGCLT